MKHLKLFFALFAMLALGFGNAWGAEVTLTGDYTNGGPTGWSQTGSKKTGYWQLGTDGNYIQSPKFSSAAVGVVTVVIEAYVTGSSKSSDCQLVGLDSEGNTVETQTVTCSSTNMTSTYPTTSWVLNNAENNIQQIKFIYKKATSSNMRVKNVKITYNSGSTEPVLSATPTEIDFGTVYQGTTVEDKTVAVNFENLTGAVTYSGLSTPFTATGAISATGDKITISADASTIGEHSQTLTIQSAADSKTAEVTVKMNVEAPFNGKKLGFDFVNHPTGWPVKSNATAGEYVYNLDDTDYTFKHSKSGDGVYVAGTSGTSGYLLIASGNTLGLPAIKGHKLVKVQGTLNNSGSPSTSASVSITDGTNTLSGGTAQTWNTKGGIYTYSLSGTQANTMYYLSVSNKNLQMITLVLYYEECEKYALTITEPTEGGTLVVKDGENTLTSGAEIYEGTKLTVTATPETGYEDGVVVVKNASDEDITATVYADGVLTMPAYAVTISATFEKKPCELLAKPTVSATTTYSSATLTWEAVANAAKYSVKVGTADAVETTETSYEVTGLNAETTYTYQVQAIAEAGQDTYCDSEVAEVTFTTTAAPVATLTLKDIVGTTTLTGSLNGTITLPTEAAECSKTFVGWDADENCNHAPTYAPGAEYTLAAETQTLYAVYADGESGESVTIFSETFDGCTGKGANGDEAWSGTGIAAATLTLEGWTFEKGNAANGCAKFGSSSAKGSAETPAIAITGNATLSFRAGAWDNSSEVTTLNLSATGANLSQASVTLTKAAWTEYTIYITEATGSVKIKFEASIKDKNRFFLDDVVISQASVTYSNYSTTCAAAPKAEVTPTEVTATAAGVEGKVIVTYENVNTENVAVALFNDEACTEAFTADWLTASLDGDKNITYTVAATTLYTERKAYIQLTAPEANGTTEPAKVVIPVTQAGKEKVFGSLEELLANITPTTEGVEVTVTLTNELIVDFYTSDSYRNGIALNVPYQGGTKQIEIYCKDVPTDWVKGGKVSGTITCPWKDYYGTWELCPTAWNELTYTAPATVKSIAVSGTPNKTTYVDGEVFDPAGLVVTATLTDDSTEPIDFALVDWTFDPATLAKGQTSVNVTAQYNTLVSPAYEVTGLTVNDIPTKTVAEFIAAGGTRCYLEGIVSNITNTTYGNFDLTDASGTIYVYGCLNAEGVSQKFADLGVKNGDKIKVIADEYELYGGTKDEAKNVQYVSHISAASITIADITMEVKEVKTISATVEPAEAVVTYTIKENAANAISLSGNTITALAEGTATITATVAEGATYIGNSVDFTVTVTPESTSDEVVILAELDGKWYAMKGAAGSGTGQLAALEVTYFNGTLYNVAEADKASITWTRSVVDGKATFVNNGKYLKGKDGDLSLVTTADNNCEWTSESGFYTTGNNRTFIYRDNYNFKNYSVQNVGKSGYSGFPEVVVPVYATGDIVYTRTVTNKYGTICLPYASASTSGAYFYRVAGKETGKVYLESVDALEAGVPYIFEKTANTITVTCQGEAVAEAASANGLVGNFTNEFIVPANNYILYNNAFIPADGTTNKVNAYRAYLDLSAVTGGAPQQMPGRRYIGMDVQGENVETGVEDLFTTDAPVKVIENGQLIIIRDGVKYNVQGQKL